MQSADVMPTVNGAISRACVGASVLALAMALAGAAGAQTTTSNLSPAQDTPAAKEAEATQLQDIIVTANRRPEQLQKTAAAVTAVSGETIRALNITTPQGLSAVVPNLVIGENGSSAQVGIRGAISTSPGPFNDPAVGFSVDGVYLARASAALSSLYDISQVEVLRGPQGTLYGRNTIAGLINVITAKPKLSGFEGNASLGYGNYNDLQSSAMLNVPLSTTVAVRAAFNSERHDGYSKNAPSDDYNDRDAVAGRLQFLWKPSDKFDAVLGFSAYHNGGVGGGGITGGAPLGLYAQSANARPFNYEVPDTGAYTDEFTRDVTLTANYNLPFATLTYVGNYRRENYEGSGALAVQGPFANTFANGICSSVNDPTCFMLSTRSNSEQDSHEVRLAHASDRFKWVVGGYYYRYTDTNLTTLAPCPCKQPFDIYAPGSDVETTHAVFGQATYSILPRLRVTGGVRYNDELKGSVSQTYFPPLGAISFFDCAAGCTTGGNTTTGRFRLHKVTWRGGLDFDLTDDILIFGSVANGFKNGGINNTGTTFKPEEIVNYELGFKSSFLNKRLQLNIDAFYEDYKNYQSTAGQLVNNTVNLVTVNAGHAKIKGVELESLALVTPRDRVGLNATYLHAYFTSFPLPFGDGFNGGAPEDLSGNRVPYTPKVTIQFDYQHTFRLASGGQIVPRVNFNYVARQNLDYHEFAAVNVPSYTRTEATVTWNLPRTGRVAWSVTAYAKNLENHAVLVTGQVDNTLPLALAGQAGKDGFYLAPRTYGARVTAAF